MTSPLRSQLTVTQTFQQHTDNGNLPPGTDFQTLPDINQPCFAVETGEVVFTGIDNIRQSIYVQVNSTDRAWFYVHLNSYSVKVGDKIQEGTQVGNCGTSGNVAPHLHLGCMVNGVWSDPELYLLQTNDMTPEQVTDLFNRLQTLQDGENIILNEQRTGDKDRNTSFEETNNAISKIDTEVNAATKTQATIDDLNSKLQALQIENNDLKNTANAKFTEVVIAGFPTGLYKPVK